MIEQSLAKSGLAFRQSFFSSQNVEGLVKAVIPDGEYIVSVAAANPPRA